jgi:hypothetical protein
MGLYPLPGFFPKKNYQPFLVLPTTIENEFIPMEKKMNLFSWESDIYIFPWESNIRKKSFIPMGE